MDLVELVRAVRRYDALAAREWVAAAGRTGLCVTQLPRPAGLDELDIAIAAGVAELLAARWGQPPPSWTRDVPAAPQDYYLVKAAATLPRLRKSCQQDGPEPLRRRRLFAPAEFLTIA